MSKSSHLKLVHPGQPEQTEDLTTRYVRVRSTERAGYVEFDFAIGDPTLFVELVLPVDAFRAFCESNNVVEMDAEQAAAVDDDAAKWRYGDPAHRDTHSAD